MQAAVPLARLAISTTPNPTVVSVTLLNTVQGQLYRLERLANSREFSWQVVQEVTGTGEAISIQVDIGNESIGLFRAIHGPTSPVAFDGLSYSETGIDPPDVAGAVGREHIVQMMNSKMAVFDREGNPVGSPLELSGFFETLDAVDPRILFDDRRDRWVASCVERTRLGDRFFPVRTVHLAVSKGSDPTPSPDNWWRFTLNFELPKSDFDTLGMDSNGVYLTVTFLESAHHHVVVALPKELLYAGVLEPTLLPVAPTELAARIIQPAVNADDVPADAPVIFVAKGVPHQAPPPDYRGGAIHYRRLVWQGTRAVWSDDSWASIPDAGNDYRNYFDFDGGSTGAPQRQDELGGSLDIKISRTGSRLCQAFIRDRHLWVAHHVGLSGPAGTYTGGPEGTTVDRSAIQWIKLRMDAVGVPLAYSNHGRIWDPAEADPVWFHFPSVAVNPAGDALFGFSGTGRRSYLSAYSVWIPSDETTIHPIVMLKEGQAPCLTHSGADYSTTCIEPGDDSIWTFQMYAGQDLQFRTLIRRLSAMA